MSLLGVRKAVMLTPGAGGGGRPNLLVKTMQFDDAAWAKVLGASVTPDTAADPNGVTTVDTITFSANNANRVEQITAIPSVVGHVYTGSIWLSGTGTMRINVSSSTGAGGSSEKLVTLTSTLTRHEITHTFTAGAGGFVRFMAALWRTGDSAASVNVWRAKLELGSEATAWVPG